jgi:hypothetical protein
MSVTTVGKHRSGSHVRGRLYTSSRAKSRVARRQVSGRIFTGLLATAGAGVGIFLAPTYLLPIGLMCFFVAVAGMVADEIGPSRHLALRLVGPGLALAGLGLVVWLLVSGGL